MKYIAFFVLFLISFTLTAQTKLINHKSHSGTNQTFNPHVSEGNFGVPPVRTFEIQKDDKSRYKLIKTSKSGQIITTFLLFKQDEKDKKTSTYLGLGQILLQIQISGDDTDDFAKTMKEMLIKKLKNYRKNEK